jgi:hypothetical protein
MNKENIDLAKKHVEIAEELIGESIGTSKDKKTEKELTEAEFALEKAEAEISDLEDCE